MASELRAQAEERLDAFLRSVGLEPASLTDERGLRSFGIGSVRGRAGVLEAGDRLLLWAEAELCELPADGDMIVPLMRELLERNAVIAPSHFAIRNELVVLTVARDLADGIPDAGTLINQLMAQADALDEGLLQRYGGTARRRTPLPAGALDPASEPPSVTQAIATQSKGEAPPPGNLFERFDKLRRERE
jgi:hypothetical protein